jgi:hypothetical protein
LSLITPCLRSVFRTCIFGLEIRVIFICYKTII